MESWARAIKISDFRRIRYISETMYMCASYYETPLNVRDRQLPWVTLTIDDKNINLQIKKHKKHVFSLL